MQQKPPTLKDIAKRCGVDVSTVSRALRDPHMFREELTQRIVSTAAELGYDPMRQDWARRMSLRRHGKEAINHLVALVYPPNFYIIPFYANLFQGLLDVFTPAGFSMLTTAVKDFYKYPLAPSFSRGDVDGVIIQENVHDMPRSVQKLRDEPSFGERPLLTLFHSAQGCSSSQVDYFHGSYLVASHLLDLGHRHLLVIADLHNHMQTEPDDFFYHRAEGYRQAYSDHGLDPDRYLSYLQLSEELDGCVIQSPPAINMQEMPFLARSSGDWLMDELRRNPQISAILAINDLTAILIAQILQLNGLRVPEDISLVGYDDTVPLLDEQRTNRLTTVHVPVQDVGREAARLMLKLVTEPTHECEIVKLPTTFIPRATTAPPKRRK